MLRICLPRPFLIGTAAAALFALPALAGDDSYGNDRPFRSLDHAWYGDNDFSRCPWHRPRSVFLDGEGGFQAWRVPHRVCGHGHEPESQRYGGSVTPHG